jgi:ubiquinone/menaquinone biosynthesis C-methylase UbiE
MDAADHRTAKTQGRELVNSSPAVPVAEGYDRWASTYDYGPNPLLACEERHLLPIVLGLRHKRILDLACGTGRWLERLIAQGGESGVGIDSSVAMLRVAGKKDTISGRLAQAACESLPFRSTVFDLAICSFSLGHIRDMESMVRELARVTKPGADVLVSDLHPEAYARGWRVGFRDQDSAVQIETLPRTAEEIVQAFHANGLECLTHMSLRLGDPEQAIFARAGKGRSFQEACQLPAILACHFKRLPLQTAPISNRPLMSSMNSSKTDDSTRSRREPLAEAQG